MGTQVPCNDIDRHLFNASKVIIDNGNRARFWKHSWLNGEAPRYLAPNLFKLVRRKNRTVHQELYNGNWIRSNPGVCQFMDQITRCAATIRCTRHDYLKMDARWQLLHPLRGYSSVVHARNSNMNSSGRHERKISAKFTPGSSSTTKF